MILRRRWIVAITLGLVTLGLFISPRFATRQFGSFSLALWLYVLGLYVWRNQTHPFPFPVRLVVSATIFCSTVGVTLLPWLFYGGREGCSHFDPTMTTENGQNFEDLWILMCIRMAMLWILALVAVYMSLADHPSSTYVRQSIRCALYFWQSRLIRSISSVQIACKGTDVNKDGRRDMVIIEQTDQLAVLLALYGVAATILGDIWCLQLLIERLLALEEAFGEPLPCARPVVWLSRFLILCLLLLVAGSTFPSIGLISCLCGSFGLICIIGMIWSAYSLPLRALRTAQKMDATNAVGMEFQKETAFAIRVIKGAQFATLLAGSSMALYLTFLGLLRVIKSLVLFNAYQYGAEVDTLGNVLSLILLTVSSLSSPRWRRRTVEVRTAAPEVPDRPGHEMTCTCGKNLAEAQVGLPMDMEGGLCDACSWERKVAELANRRISVLQLLSFYERLGEKPDRVEMKAESMSHTPSEKLPTGKRVMPHFVPEVSTTNDVVRHAIIPESRTGDEGEALAEVLWREAHTTTGRTSWSVLNLASEEAPRMVTHHWGNRFCHLVAAVIGDSLHLSRWDSVAEQLIAGDLKPLKRRLRHCGSEDWQYWICAICINQHASICGSSMGVRDTVTGEVLPSCDCLTPKYFNDHPIQCELNKFDCMMKLLHRRHSATGGGTAFLQVVAIDRDFSLFSRAWCVAELVEAYNSKMDQHVMLHSPEVLERNSARLKSLKVEECSASRIEDKEAILSKIGPSPEIAKFNERLQQLLLGSKGLLAGWLDGQKLLQEVGTIAARARARCQREIQISVTAPNNPTDCGEASVQEQVPATTKIHL